MNKRYLQYICFIFLWNFSTKPESYMHVAGHSLLTHEQYQLFSPYIYNVEAIIKEFPYRDYQIYFVPAQGWFYIDLIDDCIKRVLSQSIPWDGSHINKYRAHIKPGTIAIDIGAYVGTHTIKMSSLVTNSGLVITFEPQRKIYNELTMNIRLNDCRNVLSVCCALGDTNENAYLGAPIDNNEAARYISKNNPIDLVPVQTLDYFNLSNVSFIKISVENTELEVLEGAYNTIMQNKPIIYLKIQGNQLKAAEDQVNMQEKANCVISKLESWNYQVELIDCCIYIAFPNEFQR